MKEQINLKYKEEEVVVTNKYIDIEINGEIVKTLSLNRLIKKENIKVSDEQYEETNKINSLTEIDGKKIYTYFGKTGKLYVTTNPNKFYKIKQRLMCKMTKRFIYFGGWITNINHKVDGFDNVLLNEEKVAKIKRISKIKKIRNLGFFRIPISAIEKTDEIHNALRIGENMDYSVPVRMKRKYKGMNYYAKKNINGNYIIVRSIINGNKVKITKIPMQPEYKKVNLLKNYIASKLYKVVRKNKILMFEKETARAEESGYYMFEKIMKEKEKDSIKNTPYFIIDKNASVYNEIKQKYGKNIIEKYSFKHYLYIYASKYFISSELSNHVINPRLYIKNLNKVISQKPLIFLQHGIMFAKPVDNPAAMGFHKGKTGLNVYKNVISSDLEATQFYKMGYNDDDLIKCGLTKFDISYKNKDADKIMYMPTYRYWEEASIMNQDEIKNTTYYKSYMDAIKKFEDAGLLDKLMISCHPKFKNCLMEVSPKYQNIIQDDVSKGLKEAAIFITDYSSASYDAHYRGAYIIYNWSEKDYLIENYQAIPPIDETNCDGVPVYNLDDLIKEVKRAIKNNYKMDKLYEDRYKKINEFSDGKNGDRLIDELKKLEIL